MSVFLAPELLLLKGDHGVAKVWVGSEVRAGGMISRHTGRNVSARKTVLDGALAGWTMIMVSKRCLEVKRWRTSMPHQWWVFGSTQDREWDRKKTRRLQSSAIIMNERGKPTNDQIPSTSSALAQGPSMCRPHPTDRPNLDSLDRIPP